MLLFIYNVGDRIGILFPSITSDPDSEVYRTGYEFFLHMYVLQSHMILRRFLPMSKSCHCQWKLRWLSGQSSVSLVDSINPVQSQSLPFFLLHTLHSTWPPYTVVITNLFSKPLKVFIFHLCYKKRIA